MRILIIGAGEVGFHLARRLSDEGQDVVLVEMDPDRASRASDQLDVLTVTGNGASLPVLQEAGIARANLVLAVTSKDEVNVLACLAASRYDVDFTVARVAHPEYYAPGSVLPREHLGIDLMINPERECAWETFQLLNSAAATDLIRFAEGRIQLIGLRVRPGARVVGKTLIEIDRDLTGHRYVIAAIVRDGTTEIPRGSSRIEAGDQIFVLAPTPETPRIPRLAGYEAFRLRRVMIAGGSKEAVHLAGYLEEHDVACTILELDRRRCAELAEILPSALVLNGDATDLELLEMEGVEGIDGFVAYTGRDETNMLSSLLAKTSGARKVISLIHRFEYLGLVGRVGIDAAVSPRMSTVNAILRYVRRGKVERVATMKGVDAEALELEVGEQAPVLGKRVWEAGLPRDAVLGAILRDDRVILPRGQDTILPGDRVIIFAVPAAIPALERLLA